MLSGLEMTTGTGIVEGGVAAEVWEGTVVIGTVEGTETTIPVAGAAVLVLITEKALAGIGMKMSVVVEVDH